MRAITGWEGTCQSERFFSRVQVCALRTAAIFSFRVPFFETRSQWLLLPNRPRPAPSRPQPRSPQACPPMNCSGSIRCGERAAGRIPPSGARTSARGGVSGGASGGASGDAPRFERLSAAALALAAYDHDGAESTAAGSERARARGDKRSRRAKRCASCRAACAHFAGGTLRGVDRRRVVG